MQMTQFEDNQGFRNVLAKLEAARFHILLGEHYLASATYLGSDGIEAEVLDDSEIAEIMRTGVAVSLEFHVPKHGVYCGFAKSEIVGRKVMENKKVILQVRLMPNDLFLVPSKKVGFDYRT